ncbi:MAG TPA: PQQ-dependent sugar dehydrogenase [Pseudonocardiaceae bacterium]
MPSLRRPLLILGLTAAVALSQVGLGPAAAQEPDPAAPTPEATVTVTIGSIPFRGAGSDQFEKKRLTTDVGEPMALAVAPDGRVLMTDRRGVVRIFDPTTHNVTVAGQIPVYTGEEDGLQGIALDPDFVDNHWVYVYYSPAGTEPKNVLARFRLEGNTLDMSSEQRILEVPTQRDLCCHVGGDIDFDAEGNLYLSTGDNTNSWASDGYTPIDERPGREPFDAQRTSANTNDLRGKLLRIKVNEDGSYSIPEGNLFPPGTPQTRPEIYYMGLRNPFRFAVDQKTGWVWMGVVGPDASEDNPDRGPRQYEELLLITQPGNSGWPYCIADDIPYRDYDFATGESGPPFDCDNLVNDSPNNTGLRQIPPADEPLIWYPYACFDKFPQIDCPGGGTAMGGPVYRYDPDLDSETKFPPEFDGAEFFYEYSRGFVKTVRVDEAGNLVSIDPFLPELDFDQPMDLEFGPEGSLYVLEYGGGFFTPGPNAGLYRIDYTRGAHSPTATLTAGPTSGAAPLTVHFDASGSSDADGDEISFAWDFDGDGTDDAHGPTATHTYTTNGSYQAKLTVTDATGKVTVARTTIVVGNHAPQVELQLPADGGLFEFGDQVSYRVSVTDVEDGTTGAGIDCDDVTVQVALGHDEHAHPQRTLYGCEGVITTQTDDGHGPGSNLFVVLRASYTDRGGDGAPPTTGTQEIVLQPKRKQAEHADASEGTVIVDDTAAEAGKAVGDIDAGDWIVFDPMHLGMVQSVSARVSTDGAGGDIQLRAGAPNGALVATLSVPGGGGSGQYVDIGPVPVTDPGGSGPLYVVFAGSAGDSTGEQDLFRLDYLQFTGLGAAGPLNVHAKADALAGAAPLRTTLQAEVAGAPADAVYSWDFGDGRAGQGRQVTHTYTRPGSYTATVKVTDAEGNHRGSSQVTIRVERAVTGWLALTPDQAAPATGEQHRVTATFDPRHGRAHSHEVTFEVYRASRLTPVPDGLEGTAYVLMERGVSTTDRDGRAGFAYTSSVAAHDVVVACLGFGGSCLRGDGPLVVDDTGPVNLRDDLILDTVRTEWRAVPDADGWITLFDGRSLVGWDYAGSGGFTVDDGMLVTQGGGRGLLWYAEQQFGDYVLQVDYEHHSVSDNSGIYLRFPDPQGGMTIPDRQGYQVSILDRVDDVRYRTGSIDGIKAAEFLAAKPVGGGWNTFEIQVIGQEYQVTLNGQVVTTYTGDRALSGFVGIENASAGINFRNIRIKPLSPAGS